MSSKRCLLLLIAGLTASTLVTATAQSGEAKSKKKTHTSKSASKVLVAHRGSRSGLFVPPPPAYMPSILPELYGKGYVESASASTEPKPDTPYSKYIYTRNPNDAPTIVQPSKYVTVWNKT